MENRWWWWWSKRRENSYRARENHFKRHITRICQPSCERFARGLRHVAVHFLLPYHRFCVTGRVIYRKTPKNIIEIFLRTRAFLNLSIVFFLTTPFQFFAYILSSFFSHFFPFSPFFFFIFIPTLTIRALSKVCSASVDRLLA